MSKVHFLLLWGGKRLWQKFANRLPPLRVKDLHEFKNQIVFKISTVKSLKEIYVVFNVWTFKTVFYSSFYYIKVPFYTILWVVYSKKSYIQTSKVHYLDFADGTSNAYSPWDIMAEINVLFVYPRRTSKTRTYKLVFQTLG